MFACFGHSIVLFCNSKLQEEQTKGANGHVKIHNLITKDVSKVYALVEYIHWMSKDKNTI